MTDAVTRIFGTWATAPSAQRDSGRALRWFVIITCANLASACTVREVVIGARGDIAPVGPSGLPVVGDAALAGERSPAGKASDGSASLSDSGASNSPSVSDAKALAPASAGCGMVPVGPDSLSLDSGSAEYLIDLPPSYDRHQPYPLVLAFHGAPDKVEAFREKLNFGGRAAAAAIIVHPELVTGAPFWRVPDDLDLFEALLNQLLQRYCIDKSRVFALGYAQGGWLVSAYACMHGSQIRGAALFAGTMAIQPCTSPVAMIVFQGTDDSVYPVRDGRQTRDSWAAVDQCDTTQTSPVDAFPCVALQGCAPGAPVHYCEFKGGHELPSFAAEATWRFFSSL